MEIALGYNPPKKMCGLFPPRRVQGQNNADLTIRFYWYYKKIGLTLTAIFLDPLWMEILNDTEGLQVKKIYKGLFSLNLLLKITI
jgi:hypothetical protein